ncbi:unnamed protein product [Zymoseptoria tritici ST99CH_3D1]|uniref:Uncharacterized protein n=1 Tax=Zymoseptoria tritici ST99CH_1E4 TaxID=1276532 RepID=A0A2H1HBW0_ZYMTR|nr:unnamed protein product [Zymoseptoria tritici ST99CH_1E4]SMR65232.1 unnamed protein product [Zymoseptoria tritici ST99CH_3D1]
MDEDDLPDAGNDYFRVEWERHAAEAKYPQPDSQGLGRHGPFADNLSQQAPDRGGTGFPGAQHRLKGWNMQDHSATRPASFP